MHDGENDGAYGVVLGVVGKGPIMTDQSSCAQVRRARMTGIDTATGRPGNRVHQCTSIDLVVVLLSSRLAIITGNGHTIWGEQIVDTIG